MAGATAASSTSRAAATRRRSTSRPRPSPRSSRRRTAFGTVLENVVDRRGRPPRLRRRLEDREHAGGLQAREDPERPADEDGRASEERRLPRRRRVRRPAADRAARRRAGALLLPLRFHVEARRAPRSASPSPSRRSRPASARRSCRSARRSTRGCSARSSPSTGRTSGSSTRAGPAARRRRSATATGCRSRRPGRCSTQRSPARLDDVEYRVDETFGFEVPVSVPGVDPSLLDPRSTWGDPRPTTRRPVSSRTMFRKNFEKFPDAGDDVASRRPEGLRLPLASRSAFGRFRVVDAPTTSS